MQKIINIGGSLIIAITISSVSLYLGSILAFGEGGIYIILIPILWYVFPPLIFVVSIYFGYRNSKIENQSKVFSWIVRICSLVLLGYLIWWASFIFKNMTADNQIIESNVDLRI